MDAIISAAANGDIDLYTTKSMIEEIPTVVKQHSVSSGRKDMWTDDLLEKTCSDIEHLCSGVLDLQANPGTTIHIRAYHYADALGASYVVTNNDSIVRLGEYKGIRAVTPSWFSEHLLTKKSDSQSNPNWSISPYLTALISIAVCILGVTWLITMYITGR